MPTHQIVCEVERNAPRLFRLRVKPSSEDHRLPSGLRLTLRGILFLHGPPRKHRLPRPIKESGDHGDWRLRLWFVKSSEKLVRFVFSLRVPPGGLPGVTVVLNALKDPWDFFSLAQYSIAVKHGDRFRTIHQATVADQALKEFDELRPGVKWVPGELQLPRKKRRSRFRSIWSARTWCQSPIKAAVKRRFRITSESTVSGESFGRVVEISEHPRWVLNFEGDKADELAGPVAWPPAKQRSKRDLAMPSVELGLLHVLRSGYPTRVDWQRVRQLNKFLYLRIWLDSSPEIQLAFRVSEEDKLMLSRHSSRSTADPLLVSPVCTVHPLRPPGESPLPSIPSIIVTAPAAPERSCINFLEPIREEVNMGSPRRNNPEIQSDAELHSSPSLPKSSIKGFDENFLSFPPSERDITPAHSQTPAPIQSPEAHLSPPNFSIPPVLESNKSPITSPLQMIPDSPRSKEDEDGIGGDVEEGGEDVDEDVLRSSHD